MVFVVYYGSMLSKLKIIIIFSFLFFPLAVFARQPSSVEGNFTVIEEPLVSQAYYGDLNGATSTFRFTVDHEFGIYVSLLLPDVEGVDTDIFAKIYIQNQDGGKDEVAFLDGENFLWERHRERFVGGDYLWGPEFTGPTSTEEIAMGAKMPAGVYIINVYSKDNDQKFALAMGNKDVFMAKTTLAVDKTPPPPRKDFFDLSFFGAFSEKMAVCLLVPLGMVLLSLLTAVAITMKQVRDKLKHLES